MPGSGNANRAQSVSIGRVRSGESALQLTANFPNSCLPGKEFPEVAVVGAPGVRRCGCLDEMQDPRVGAGNSNRGDWGGGGCGERGWF